MPNPPWRKRSSSLTVDYCWQQDKSFAPNNFHKFSHMCDLINRPNVILIKMMCIQFLLSWYSLIICNFVISWCRFINRSIPVWSIRECWMEPEIDAYFDFFITHSCCGSSCCKLAHTGTVSSISRAVLSLECGKNLHLPGFTLYF